MPGAFVPGDEADLRVRWQEKVFGPQEIITVSSGQQRHRHRRTKQSHKRPLSRLEVITCERDTAYQQPRLCIWPCESGCSPCLRSSRHVRPITLLNSLLPTKIKTVVGSSGCRTSREGLFSCRGVGKACLRAKLLSVSSMHRGETSISTKVDSACTHQHGVNTRAHQYGINTRKHQHRVLQYHSLVLGMLYLVPELVTSRKANRIQSFLYSAA